MDHLKISSSNNLITIFFSLFLVISHEEPMKNVNHWWAMAWESAGLTESHLINSWESLENFPHFFS